MAPVPSPDASRPVPEPLRKRFPALVQWLEVLVLLAMVGLLGYDRIQFGRQFLFRYADEDQTLLWHAAGDLLHGHIAEPCFYGQSFNSCIEGYLAAPLILVHMLPYWVAVPSVSIVLGLFPFLAMAWVAWRRGHPVLAATALFIPLSMPVRYAMLTGMPRGFVTGIALATIPCLLLLRKQAEPTEALPSRWQGRRKAIRYFFIGLLSVVALMLNPNCCLLLAPALLFAIATRIRQADFWLFSSLGAFLGALYPLGVFYFYFKLHDDYRFYHREEQYTWTFQDFQDYLHHLQVPLADFVPAGLAAWSTSWVLAAGFGGVLLYFLAKRQWPAALATIVSVGFTLFTIGFTRVHEGRSSVFFSYSRMYLALPVLPILLVLWGTHQKVNAPKLRIRPWVTWSAMLGVVAGALYASHRRTQVMPEVIATELKNVQMVQLVDVDEGRDLAKAVQTAADAQNAHLVLLASGQKRWTYLLPALTNCQTLLPFYERRTWRLEEECFPRYTRILILDRGLFDKARKGFFNAAVVSEQPFIGAFDIKGKSVIRVCQELGMEVRAFKLPAGADVLP